MYWSLCLGGEGSVGEVRGGEGGFWAYSVFFRPDCFVMFVEDGISATGEGVKFVIFFWGDGNCGFLKCCAFGWIW